MARNIDERQQRLEYGGFHFGAAFFGWLVAVGVGSLLTALVAAVTGAVALTTVDGNTGALTQTAPTVGVVSGILLLLALAVAYYAGGYVAGRMSRFDGGRQGFGVWAIGFIVTLLLAVAGAIFGANYNLLQQINASSIPVGIENATISSIVTALLLLVITALAAIAGGRVGEAYHRRIDRVGERSSIRPVEEPRERTGDEAFTRRHQPAFGERIHDRNSRRRDR